MSHWENEVYTNKQIQLHYVPMTKNATSQTQDMCGKIIYKYKTTPGLEQGDFTYITFVFKYFSVRANFK